MVRQVILVSVPHCGPNTTQWIRKEYNKLVQLIEIYIETVEMTHDKMSSIWRLRFILSKSSIESSDSWTKIDKFMLTKLIEILIEMECVKLNWLTSFQKRALLGPISLPDSHRFWLSFVSVASFFWRAIINCFSCLATFLATFLKGIYIIYWIL